MALLFVVRRRTAIGISQSFVTNRSLTTVRVEWGRKLFLEVKTSGWRWRSWRRRWWGPQDRERRGSQVKRDRDNRDVEQRRAIATSLYLSFSLSETRRKYIGDRRQRGQRAAGETSESQPGRGALIVRRVALERRRRTGRPRRESNPASEN